MTLSHATDGAVAGARTPALPLAARRHPLVHHVTTNLAQRCGVAGRARVVLGVSGGADSLALAVGFLVLRERGEVEPIVVHVHHHLRESADDDAAHVERFCASCGLPFRLMHVRPAAEAGNISAAARGARYAALEETAREERCKFIATAHHAEDQFETILMALCRGSEAALRGMRWRRPIRSLEEASSPILIRPLLDASRNACESLCAAAGIAWRTDPTNFDISRSRARIRAEVLPVLESIWPGASQRAVAAMQSLAEGRDAIDDVLDVHFGSAAARRWSRTGLRALAPAVVRAGLRRAALDALGGEHADDLSRVHLDAAAAAIADEVSRPRSFQWPGSLYLTIRAREVALGPQEHHEP